METKKILLLAASLKTGGAEKFCRDLALCGPEGYEFHYIVFDKETTAYETALKAAGCTVFHLKPPGKGYFAYLMALRRILAKTDYAAVHTHNMFGGGFLLWAAWAAGVPVRIAHAHSQLREGGPGRRIYESAMTRLICRCATCRLACSDGAGARLFGVREWRTIPNGVCREAFVFSEALRRSCRESHGLEGYFVLGHAGHLNRVKNQIFLLDLLPRLQTIRKTKLLLLGDGPDRAWLDSEIHRRKLEEFVLMPGNAEDMRPFYCAMDVFCLPSLYEGMPLALLEARCCGLPCLISDRVEYRDGGTKALSLADAERWVAELSAIHGRIPGTVPELRECMAKIYTIYSGENP